MCIRDRYRYIQKENKKGKKLFGGIVANTDPRKYKGRWVYFDKPSKELKDNFANWDQLRMTQAMLLNMSLSGLIMIGADIGGFVGAPSGELYTRWLQQGIFYPFCRTHTAVYHPSQDPFSYGKKVREISKKVIELRYRLLPYTYSYFWQAYKRGLPVLRPLFLEFPEDERTYQISEQFMWGEWLLVAPVLKEGAQQITIYLPEGKWYWFESSEELKGAGEKVIPVELSSLPVLVREGGIIPLAPVTVSYTHLTLPTN